MESVPSNSFYGTSNSIVQDTDNHDNYNSVRWECFRNWIWRHIQINKLQKSNEPWFIFHKLQSALDFMFGISKQVHVFSFEDSNSSHIYRKYLVTDYKTFWKRYCNITPLDRHYYELIPTNYPCKLYFDIEFKKDLNPDLDAECHMNNLKNSIQEALENEYKISRDLSKIIIELDSTSSIKFSRHLIFPKVIFKNNIIMGTFVKKLCMLYGNYWMVNTLFESNGSYQRGFLIDEHVYDKNRTFRIYGSCKAGKYQIFRPVSNSQWNDEDEHFLFFLDSLICHVQWNEGNTRTLGQSGQSDINIEMPRVPKSNTCYNKDSCNRSTESVYPHLDHWIESFILGHQGHIRNVTIFSKVLVYDITGNRYCDIVQRQHKSNNVQIVLYLQKGYWCRHCLDPECKFKNRLTGKIYPIPTYLNPLYHFTELDESSSLFHNLVDDQDLLSIPLDTNHGI